MKSKIISLILGLFVIMAGLCSCNVDITLQQKKDGSVDIQFSTGALEAFSTMMMGNSGDTSLENFIDAKEIQYQLGKAGFSKVNISATTNSAFSIFMSDEKKSSYLFTSGLVESNKGKLRANINCEKLVKFYKASDEQTQMMLDLLLSPVFNDEEMSKTEYLEMIETVYGKNAVAELDKSLVSITLINADGTKSNQKIPLVDLLTLEFEITF